MFMYVVTMTMCGINLIGNDMVTLPRHVSLFHYFVGARDVGAFLLLLSLTVFLYIGILCLYSAKLG